MARGEDLKAVWEWELLRSLSAPARVVFMAVAVVLIVGASIFFVMGFLEGDGQTPLVLFFGGIYAGLAYIVIWLADQAVRRLARRVRN